MVLLVCMGVLGVWLASMYCCCLRPCPMKSSEMKDFKGPIDLVYTWVDGHDRAWAKAQDEARIAQGLKPIDPERNPTPGLTKDELYHSIRFAQHYLPWHRRIYILTQKPQRPKWLPEDSERLCVVHHEDIFSPHATLPSYNGLLNYSQVHHIPGLAEHFIYFDDDHFIGQPLDPGHFFDGKGQPVYKLLMELVAWVEPSPYAAILRHTHRLTRRYTGSPWLFRPNHLPLPLTRSACYAMEGRLGPRLLSRMGPFRSKDSYEFHFLVINDLLANHQTRRPHPSLKTKFIRRVNPKALNNLLDDEKRPHIYCINAGFDGKTSSFFDDIYRDRDQ